MSEQIVANNADIPAISEPTPRFAGFWMRFWAYLADIVIVFSINGILLSPLKFFNNGMPLDVGFWTVSGIASTLVLYIYFIIMTKVYGQTIGKMIFGLKVIRKHEEPLKWSDVIFRELVARFFYRFIFIAQLLYIVVAFDNSKQGLHDMISDTYVIHDRER